jgi:hypothetical protein
LVGCLFFWLVVCLVVGGVGRLVGGWFVR